MLLTLILKIGNIIVMNNIRHIVLIAVILSLISCRTLKEKESVRESVKITPAGYSELKVKAVCDSLGNIVPIYYAVENGKVKTIVQTIKDTLLVQVKQDSIVEVEKVVIAKQRVEVPVTPKWIYYVIIYCIIVTFLVYLKIVR